MAERNPAVIELVRKRIDEDPDLTPTVLRPEAAAIDPSINDLSVRQFNGLYVLGVKRERRGDTAANEPKTATKRNRSDPKRRRAPKASTHKEAVAKPQEAPAAPRDLIRTEILKFAKDLSEANSKVETIRAIQELDGHVDRIMELLGSSR